MTHSSAFRRAASLLGASGLALGTLTGAAPSASAVPFAGTVTKLQGFFDSGGCGSSNFGGNLGTSPFSTNAPASLSHSGSSASTSAPVGDAVQMSASVSGTLLVSEAAGALTGFDLSATVAASAVRTKGAASTCEPEASAATTTSGDIHIGAPAVLDLVVETHGTGLAQNQVSLVASTPPHPRSTVEVEGHPGRTHHLVVVPAGDYHLSFLIGNITRVDLDVEQVSSRFEVHGALKPLGSAEAPATGSALKYLTLPDSQSCAAHAVTADFTNKAGKKAKKGKKPLIKKATFFVNGVKAQTARKPNKKTLVTLTGLPVDSEVTVSAQLKLTHKGSVTVERTYYPCS